MTWKVTPDENGRSLLAFLKSKFPQFSGKQIKRLVDNGQCQLNSRTERFGNRVVGKGDLVTAAFDTLVEERNQKTQVHSNVTSQTKAPTPVLSQQIAVLYADDQIVALDKPPGIASDDPRLTTNLITQMGNLILLHRLDKGTSGVLLFARNEAFAKHVEELFRLRQVKKTYLAIVDGIPKKKQGRIANFLGKKHAYSGQSIWGSVTSEKGVSAVTEWKLEYEGKESSLVRCYPETGRTHQLRVHLSEMGHPILGDHQYCRRFHSSYQAPRVMLHAEELRLKWHEGSGEREIVIKSPIPKDFNEAIKLLGLHG